MDVELLDPMDGLGLGLIGPELHLDGGDPLEVRLALLEVFLEAGLVLDTRDGRPAEAVRRRDKPSPANQINLHKKLIQFYYWIKPQRVS